MSGSLSLAWYCNITRTETSDKIKTNNEKKRKIKARGRWRWIEFAAKARKSVAGLRGWRNDDGRSVSRMEFTESEGGRPPFNPRHGPVYALNTNVSKTRRRGRAFPFRNIQPTLCLLLPSDTYPRGCTGPLVNRDR